MPPLRTLRLVLAAVFAFALIPVGGPALAQAEGKVYVKESHGEWEVRCSAAQGSEQCQLYQLLRDQDGNSVAEINILRLPPGQAAIAGANIVTPLETLLTKQLKWQIAGQESNTYPFSFCMASGCVARLGFIEAEINQMRADATATVTISPAARPDRAVALTVSLTDFTKGFEALTRLSSPNTD